MTEEQYIEIRKSQRRMENNLWWLTWLATMIFVFVVIFPLLKELGWYDAWATVQ